MHAKNLPGLFGWESFSSHCTNGKRLNYLFEVEAKSGHLWALLHTV
jgi:hypothetical protein